jgi:hypothetical protein
MIASIDPGINRSGLAIFRQDKLLYATYVTGAGKGNPLAERVREMAFKLANQISAYTVNTIVTECPQIYPGKTAKGSDPTNDLIPLAQIGAWLSGYLPKLYWEQVYPREWKSQVEKKAMNERIIERLSAEERGQIQGAIYHDTIDAIGIGLHYLNRLGKVRAIARG